MITLKLTPLQAKGLHACASGTWATMCEKCFKQSGAGLGEGRGQEYTQKNHDAPFIKTGG